MYKLSIPISMITLTDENRHIYLDWLQKCGAQRVFLCCIGSVDTPDSLIHTDPERLRRACRALGGDHPRGRHRLFCGAFRWFADRRSLLGGGRGIFAPAALSVG